MNSKYQKHIDVAINEITNKKFGTTQQYLGVHEVVYEDNLPKIERIDDEHYGNNIISIFFPIKDTGFFLQINVNKHQSEIDSVWIESGHKIYLTASSKSLTYENLIEGLNFKGLDGWSIGDLRTYGKTKHTSSGISINPIENEAYDINLKLSLLLDELEKNSEGIIKLGKKADYIGIAVRKCQYIGNGNIGESLSVEEMKRLSNLNLALDIDTYIQGIPFGE